MQTLQFRETVGTDGILRLEVHDLPSGQEIEAVVVLQEQLNSITHADKSLAWIDELYGSCVEAPIERPDQGNWPEREEIL